MISEEEVGYSEEEAFLSEEGSKGNKHFDNPVKWNKYRIGRKLEFAVRRSKLYFKSIKNLKIFPNELKELEDNCTDRIKKALNGGYVHGYIPGTIYKEVSECDFGGRNRARLLYFADDDLPCIYLGYVFRRDEMGHVSKELIDAVMKSILEAKKIYLKEKRN
jgi:hypothetical protein